MSYEIGMNANSDLFIQILNYTGDGTYTKKWFSIVDLVMLFTLANGSQVKSFEPFDNNTAPLNPTNNTNLSAFLKAILADAIK
jgi:hypothetical protein